MALIFTALLAIAGYVVQSKNATAADRAQHEIVQEAADREQARSLAAIQLDRVRTQMGDVYHLRETNPAAYGGDIGLKSSIRSASF